MGSTHKHGRNDCILSAESICKHTAELFASFISITISGGSIKMACGNIIFLKSFNHFKLVDLGYFLKRWKTSFTSFSHS